MTNYEHIFGPVPSRRFGRSLGVDLTPYKTCSQDCVFCQLGRTTNKTICREEYVSIESVLEELSDWLKSDGEADHITLSGSGEPTLHIRFGEVLRFVRSHSRLPAVLLTNGSLFNLPEVRRAALNADIVKLSLSAWDQVSYMWLNRPHADLQFDRMVEGQRAFRNEFKGEIWLEVFVVAGMNSTPADLERISRLTEKIRPDRIHLNTAVRPAAEEFVAPVSREKLSSLAGIFNPPAEVVNEYLSENRDAKQGNLEKIRMMLERRPCTAEEIAGVFGMRIAEVLKYLGNLTQAGKICPRRMAHSVYYTAMGSALCYRGAEINELETPPMSDERGKASMTS